jgi:hypothetical protein
LLKVLTSNFPDEREQLLCTLIDRFPSAIHRDADIHMTAFLTASTGLASIGFSRTAGVELSFD